MVELDCAGERLGLLPEKAVVWMAKSTLIIADLHLGKSAAFRTAGIGVPETTTGADLERLGKILESTQSRRLIILGDLLHSPAGMQPAMVESVDAWLGERPDLEIILVPGNHDRNCGSLPPGWNIRCVGQLWPCGPFQFSHEPRENPKPYLMAGHLHPGLVLRDKYGPSIRTPCFLFQQDGAVLPAFGSFTGMSNIAPARGDRVFAIGGGKVMQVM
jgi:DNA ligase-associated metallophosphoesterase